MLTVRIAGWALKVSFRSCSGPSKQRRLSPKPRMSSARLKTRQAVSDTSYRALPMPTYCEPWPGKTKAMGRAPYGTISPVFWSGDGHLPLVVIPGLAHGAQVLGVLIGNRHPVFLFAGHDQL